MAGPRIPTIFDKDLWKEQEERLLDLCSRALRKLSECPRLENEEETEINRQLFFCMQKADRDLVAAGKELDHIPQPEAHNTPDPEDERQAKWEVKRPDFQWQIIDHMASVHESVRCYAIECKRLGSPSSRQWILNREYVVSGVCRFSHESHRYGNRCASGAMVGYVQTMSFEEILAEVNQNARKNCVGELTPPNRGWHDKDVSRLKSKIDRTFPISPFTLRHLWVDLRALS
jgi:hypothetical protein